MELTICPKCRYERSPQDTTSKEECPKCGVIYAKAMVQTRPGGPKVPAAWLDAEKDEAAKEPVGAPDPEPAQQIDPVVISQPMAPKQLIDCDACGGTLSHQAKACPHCAHPNPSAPRTAGMIAAVIALSLGIDAALMPYFAAVFLVPAAFAASAVTAILRMRTLAVIAAIPACVGLYGIYKTSNELRENQANLERQQGKLLQEAEAAQRRFERQMRELTR